MIKTCPSCGSPYIGGFRMGTQQVEDLVKKRFPQARVLRMDLDTTKNKDGHEKILSAFANEEADILIGTQMTITVPENVHFNFLCRLQAVPGEVIFRERL